MRDKSSVRFEPYFKLQWFDPISFAWRDVQKAYATEADARLKMTTGKEWRVMSITENGRFPLA
jgi:hypothetical protein